MKKIFVLQLLIVLVSCTPYPGYRYSFDISYSQLRFEIDSLYEADSSLLVYKEWNNKKDSVVKCELVNVDEIDSVHCYYWFNIRCNNRRIAMSAIIKNCTNPDKEWHSAIYLRSWAKGWDRYPIDLHGFGDVNTNGDKQLEYINLFEEQIVDRLNAKIVSKSDETEFSERVEIDKVLHNLFY